MLANETRNAEEVGAVAARFLDSVPLGSVTLAAGVPFAASSLALGQGALPLEVVVARTPAAPNATALRSAWKARNAGRAAPLLFVVLHDGRASLCGPAGDDPPAYLALDGGQVERICRERRSSPTGTRARADWEAARLRARAALGRRGRTETYLECHAGLLSDADAATA